MPRKKLHERKNNVIKVGIYDAKHRQQLQQRAKQVQRLYRKSIDKITKAAQPSLFGGDPAQEFHFSDFPALNKAVDKYIQEMGAGLQSNMEQGDQDAWTLANTKNDAMVDYMAGAYPGDLPKETLQKWKHPHLEALKSFMERRDAGMNLSNGGSAASKLVGVWNLDQFKNELELALELGIGQGKSAAELSKDVRQFLKYPDKLFRRVRDKDGVLRLSKAAKAFHPGRGVYRSSYKNALRLTATENNIAYRTCDHERWNSLPFVLGQEIKTSNNHTTGGHELVDICDALAGKYPVDFKFTGWHPWCRCYAVSILADEKEMDEYCRRIANGEDVSDFHFTGKQTEMPDEWNEWMKANKDRIEAAQAKGKQMPYFIKDNFKDGDPTKELRWIGEKKTAASAASTPAKPKKLTPKEIGDKRHAERTQKQIDSIQNYWDVRRLDLYDAKCDAAKKALDGSTSPNNNLKALSRRQIDIHNAIGDHKSVTEVEKLMARYEHGVEVQKAWDKILWDGFSKEQIDNCHEIEKKLHILKGRRMSTASADEQKANPKFIEKWIKSPGARQYITVDGKKIDVKLNPKWTTANQNEYHINCATCAPTYVLREKGFNITAKGRHATKNNDSIAHGLSFSTWRNQDGTVAFSSQYQAWMNKKGYTQMTTRRYRAFFEENTKEEGTYIITIGWKSKAGGGGHATILKRKADGKLVYIEPQHYFGKDIGVERPITELCQDGTETPGWGRGIMRVDDKIFDVKWLDIFDTH